MTLDTLVFDIETQNFFTDPGVGWDNFEALRISVVGVYSYSQDKYFCFEESEIGQAAELFANSEKLVGFSMNRYDVPVLNIYFQKLGGEMKIDLWAKERIDLLQEIEMVNKERISLSKLAAANLGIKKDRHGAEAIGLYRRGEIEELKKYCLKDVELTKNLYDLRLKQGFLLVPSKKTNEIIKVSFTQKPATASLF